MINWSTSHCCLADVNDSVTAFYDALVEIGMADSVTTFTQSDFARTLTSNGDGTDHAWGGIQFVVGDAIRGREMYGTYPDLALGSDNDVGGGRFIPTTSADQYAATLARWFGVDEPDLPDRCTQHRQFHRSGSRFFHLAAC